MFRAIIRRTSCTYATLDTCRSVWMTVWYAGWNKKISPCITHIEKINKYTKKNCATS